MGLALEQAIQLVSQGWVPRIRQTKSGTRIITLRSGNRERSLGKYDENIWNRLQQSRSLGTGIRYEMDYARIFELFDQGKDPVEVVKQGLADPDGAKIAFQKYCELKGLNLPNLQDLLRDLEDLRKIKLALEEHTGWCDYLDEECCRFWEYNSESEASKASQGKWWVKGILHKDGKYYLKVDDWFCSICDISTEITHLKEALDNLPISNLYEDFKCLGCGSKHHMAVKFICSVCGRESYWGYWPKCPKCKQQIFNYSQRCSKCGTELKTPLS